METFKPVFGIDLGTTFSAIAYIDEYGKPVVIPGPDNRPITPSIVYFQEEGHEYVVGELAFNYLKADPNNTVSFIKREMGNTNYKKSIRGVEYKPQEVSAFILKALAANAQTYLSQQGMDIEVKDVVITVPAYFGMEQRGATKQAGELAGLNVSMIINEPTAAALAYGINKIGKNQTVFVFDLGGGTFDVTILKIYNNDIKMIASDGDARLGGKDWDDKLVQYCVDIFKSKYNADPLDDPNIYQDIYDKILKAKISLSKMPKAKVLISYMGNTESVDISREKFEEITRDKLSQCERMCNRVLERAEMSWNQIDTVLLVGGSTYMPMVKSLIKIISNKDPAVDVNPDQCVAIGAAYQAKYRFIEEEAAKTASANGAEAGETVRKVLLGNLPAINIKECIAKPLGVIALNSKTKVEYVHPMLAVGKDIPCNVEDTFNYSYEGQTSVKAEITEGNGSVRDDVVVIGEVLLENLPPRKEGDSLIVSYNYNLDKILEVEVLDVETNRRQQGKVILEGAMTQEEMEASKRHIASMRHS